MKIVKGQTIRFTLAGHGTERLAKVYLIGREISPDRTVRIHGHLEDEEVELLPGMYLSAVIELGNTKATTLPEAAVVNYEGTNYIFVSKGSTGHIFEMIKVKTGLHDSGFVEVDLPEGMSDAKPIVVNGAYSLLSKLKNNEEE